MDAEDETLNKTDTSESKSKPKDQRKSRHVSGHYYTKKQKQRQKQKQTQRLQQQQQQKDTDTADGSFNKERVTSDDKGDTKRIQDSVKSKPLPVVAHKPKPKNKKQHTGTSSNTVTEAAAAETAETVGNDNIKKPSSKAKPKAKSKLKSSRSKQNANPKPGTSTSTSTSTSTDTHLKPKAREPKTNLKSKAKRKFKLAKRRDYQRRNIEASPGGFKLVLRLLPPGLTETEFISTLRPILEETNIGKHGISELYFVPGNDSPSMFQKMVYSRGYVVFEELEQMKQFASKVAELVFVDSKNNNAARPSLQVSPYSKTLDNSSLPAVITGSGTTDVPSSKLSKKPGKRSKVIEGTIENNELYKMFVKSIAAIDRGETSNYMTENVSLLKSMDKELEREKERLDAIGRRTNSALNALAGGKDANGKAGSGSSKLKKKKKKTKTKTKKKNKGREEEKSKEKENATKQKGRQITRVKNNVIIIEEAGRREMERRKELFPGGFKG